MLKTFTDREQAGRLLADAVALLHLVDPVVLALPRGGVPVALAVARRLHAPLDLLLVRKIGAPWQPELALAAVVDGAQPQIVIDESTFAASGVDRAWIDEQAQIELAEIERRRRQYLRGRPPVPLRGRSAIVVDDGIATGTSMKAALKALAALGPARRVLAVPVAPADTLDELRPLVDDVVCLSQPEFFHAVGVHYDDFHQLDDDEVVALLDAAPAKAAL